MNLATVPPLGLAHFSAIEVAPLNLAGLAARTGYGAIGLRLYPAFPGAPFYELPAGSAASREMQARLNSEGVRVYEIEFVTITPDFVASALTGILESASALGAQRLVCPCTNRRASVMWMPPGARTFGCRQRWGRQVAYSSQFSTPPIEHTTTPQPEGRRPPWTRRYCRQLSRSNKRRGEPALNVALRMSLVGTSRRFAAMQWFVGYRRQSGLWQAIRAGAFMSHALIKQVRVRSRPDRNDTKSG